MSHHSQFSHLPNCDILSFPESSWKTKFQRYLQGWSKFGQHMNCRSEITKQKWFIHSFVFCILYLLYLNHSLILLALFWCLACLCAYVRDLMDSSTWSPPLQDLCRDILGKICKKRNAGKIGDIFMTGCCEQNLLTQRKMKIKWKSSLYTFS